MRQSIELNITGMTCGNCASHVTNALQGVEGVEGAKVDLASGTATITGTNFDTQQLIEAVEEEGYEARPAEAATTHL